MSGVDIRIQGLVRRHQLGSKTIEVLKGLDLHIPAGQTVAIVGASGSGKSTFMHLVGMLDRPSSGSVQLDGVAVDGLSDGKRASIRNRRVGFVFQQHHLLPEHTALDNVAMPVRLCGAGVPIAHARAGRLLEAVGLGDRIDHKPGELSGGEQQRVALARALVMGPGLLLADEPTGNLDPKTADGVFDLMLELNRTLGSTLVVVTHSLDLARRFPRVLRLDQGTLVDE